MTRRLASDDGMTLIEMVISIAILSIIIVPIISSFLIGTLEENSTRARIADSASAEILSLYLPKDIEGALYVVDPKGGVSPNPADQCPASGTLKLQLEYNSDGKDAALQDAAVAYYQQTDTDGQAILTRVDCVGGAVQSTRTVVQQLAADQAQNFVVSCGALPANKTSAPVLTAPCTTDHPGVVNVRVMAQSNQVQQGTNYVPFTFNVQATVRSAAA